LPQRPFARCGCNVLVDPDVHIECPEAMHVGNDVTIMKGVVILGQPERIVLDDGVRLMPFVVIESAGGSLELGEGFVLYPHNYISLGGPEGSVTVGKNTHFAPGCRVYGHGGTRIGDHCAMAAGCLLSGVQHHITDTSTPMVTQGAQPRPVVLEDDVYLGANVVVNGGVTVRTGCVIGAGSVVTRDTEPFGFYVGIPAALKRRRKERT